jgi:hypothetical protein
MVIGQDAIGVNPHKPSWQHAEQEPPNALYRCQRYDPLSVPTGIVLATEADHTILEVERTGIADGHTMRVPCQILQHLLRTTKRLHCILPIITAKRFLSRILFTRCMVNGWSCFRGSSTRAPLTTGS